jgi:hypothetical protein
MGVTCKMSDRVQKQVQEELDKLVGDRITIVLKNPWGEDIAAKSIKTSKRRVSFWLWGHNTIHWADLYNAEGVPIGKMDFDPPYTVTSGTFEMTFNKHILEFYA